MISEIIMNSIFGVFFFCTITRVVSQGDTKVVNLDFSTPLDNPYRKKKNGSGIGRSAVN